MRDVAGQANEKMKKTIIDKPINMMLSSSCQGVAIRVQVQRHSLPCVSY